jgi:hypothetical protein
MRAIILAMLVAVGIGLGFAPSANAAPASGFGIGEGAAQNSNVTHVQHWRWGSRRGWRGRDWGRCHARQWSRWYRC